MEGQELGLDWGTFAPEKSCWLLVYALSRSMRVNGGRQGLAKARGRYPRREACGRSPLDGKSNVAIETLEVCKAFIGDTLNV